MMTSYLKDSKMDEPPELGVMLPSVDYKKRTPTALSRCADRLTDIRFYTASLTATMFSFGLAWGYFLSSITTIEKRFGFGSTETGLILGCYEMGHLSIALFISHFGNRLHIPRIIFVSFAVLGACSTILALPHFFLGPLTIGVNSVSGNSSHFDSIGQLCTRTSLLGENGSCPESESGSSSGPTNYALPAIIFVIMGMAGTPMSCLAVAYIDNNANPNNSPLLVGICFSALSLGPTAGFFLGAWCLSMFEDLTEPSISPGHPRWIGAWWLGLLISGTLQIVSCIPMMLIPRKRQSKQLEEADHTNKPETEAYTCRGLLKSVLGIIKNPVFIFLTFSGTCGIYIVAGFFSFFPKYFETQYGVPAWKANTIAGIVSGFAAGIGSIVGGAIVTKFKLRFRSTLVMCMVSVGIAVVAMLSGMFMGCDNVNLVTPTSSDSESPTSSCSSSCLCRDTEFYPVCDTTTNISYFSPCVAGCEAVTTGFSVTQTYTDCNCTSNGNARLGLCPRDCSVFIPYSVIFVIFTFTQSLITSPGVIMTMRCVKKTDKALAMGIAGCFVSLLGWMVAPVVYGMIIDSACALWQRSCGSTDTGSCWLYHNEDYRLKFHGTTLVFTMALLVCFFCAFIFSRGKNFDNPEDDVQSPTTSGDKTSMAPTDACTNLGEEAIPLRRINNNNTGVS